MGLLEYQAMPPPSLRDVAHDGVLCIFSNRSAPEPGQVVNSKVRPSLTKLHPAGSLSSSQPCWASPLAFGLIGWYLATKRMEDSVHHTLYVVFVLSMSRSWFLQRHVRPWSVHTVPNYLLTKSFDFLIQNCQKRICINLIAVDLRQKYLYPFLII
jgi:hypothetical protein